MSGTVRLRALTTTPSRLIEHHLHLPTLGVSITSCSRAWSDLIPS
jgi:hypothetical protein